MPIPGSEGRCEAFSLPVLSLVPSPSLEDVVLVSDIGKFLQIGSTFELRAGENLVGNLL